MFLYDWQERIRIKIQNPVVIPSFGAPQHFAAGDLHIRSLGRTVLGCWGSGPCFHSHRLRNDDDFSKYMAWYDPKWWLNSSSWNRLGILNIQDILSQQVISHFSQISARKSGGILVWRSLLMIENSRQNQRYQMDPSLGIFWNCEGQHTQQFAKTQESFPKKNHGSFTTHNHRAGC